MIGSKRGTIVCLQPDYDNETTHYCVPLSSLVVEVFHTLKTNHLPSILPHPPESKRVTCGKTKTP
jgi:hypothetical protein